MRGFRTAGSFGFSPVKRRMLLFYTQLPMFMQQITIPCSIGEGDTFQAIRPSRKAILRAVEAANQTDASGDSRPWCFYLIGSETAERIAWLEARRIERKESESSARDLFSRWQQVPGWIVVTCRQAEKEAQFEDNYAISCNAVQNFVLSLWSEHIDTTWITEGVIDDSRLYPLMDIDPAGEYIVGILWYGYRETEVRNETNPSTDFSGATCMRYRP